MAEGKRQSQWAELSQGLESLAEAGSIVLGAAVSLEQRLVGGMAESPKGYPATVQEAAQGPLLSYIADRICCVQHQVREAIDILRSIEKEII